jgi:hypothetical protein
MRPNPHPPAFLMSCYLPRPMKLISFHREPQLKRLLEASDATAVDELIRPVLPTFSNGGRRVRSNAG